LKIQVTGAVGCTDTISLDRADWWQGSDKKITLTIIVTGDKVIDLEDGLGSYRIALMLDQKVTL
jgi:hypothetical protein